MEKALGDQPTPVASALEVGAGTGYFTLNLALAGLIREPVATDISPGMLEVLDASAERLGVSVLTVPSDASELPFADDSFDLVFGHAVLHHLPDLDAAFAEFRRVLRPGGRIAFCGEPSRYGDRIAALPKRAALAAAPLWRALMRARPRTNGAQPPLFGELDRAEPHQLEHVVDVHAFTPGELAERAEGAGFQAVRVSGEELVAGWFGWVNRSLESTAEPDDVPWLWRQYAYRGYLALQAVDRQLLESRLPPAIFYDLLLSARASA